MYGFFINLWNYENDVHTHKFILANFLTARMSKIMHMPIKVGVCKYEMYADCWTLSLGNEVHFRDIMNVSLNILAKY